jgi:succinyl-CoA synthetase beta subunit
LDLYEYQGKQYFARFGIPTSAGAICDTVEEVLNAAETIGNPVTIKSQVQVGGRGKAGGVKLAFSREEAELHATNILGLDIKGHIVRRVWVEKTSDIAKEYYASFTLDRAAKRHLCMLSAEGGVEIEEVADTNPDAIARLHINPLDGISYDEALELAKEAKIDEEACEGVAHVLVSLYTCFVEGDADLVEINPLILTPEGKVHALDAKVTLDDAAAFRHPEWDEFRDLSELDSRERLAKEKGLQYVGLDGFVGIIANGAGLAMSTCDVVQQVGGSPANFLDIGGGANADQMANALEVITTDEKVRSIFINIFGGITRGEEVANGIVQALGRVEISVPIVVRLEGTNAPQGLKILSEHVSDRLVTEPTMLDAAKKAVEMAGGPK